MSHKKTRCQLACLSTAPDRVVDLLVEAICFKNPMAGAVGFPPHCPVNQVARRNKFTQPETFGIPFENESTPAATPSTATARESSPASSRTTARTSSSRKPSAALQRSLNKLLSQLFRRLLLLLIVI